MEQPHLADQLVLLPLFQPVDVTAYWSDRVTGPGRVVSGPGGTWNAAFWNQAG